jgi:hypothetical protein
MVEIEIEIEIGVKIVVEVVVEVEVGTGVVVVVEVEVEIEVEVGVVVVVEVVVEVEVEVVVGVINMDQKRLDELKELCENGPPGRIMAESRTAVPELIAEVEKLREALVFIRDRSKHEPSTWLAQRMWNAAVKALGRE